MNLLDRYLLTNYLKVYVTVSSVLLSLVLLYSLADFLLGFKEKALHVGLRYTLYMIPIGFYMLVPIGVNISFLIFIRRIIGKGIDITAQSFGLSPLRFIMPILLFTFLLSLGTMVMNERFIPYLFKKVWYIEKTFKKKQDIGRVVEKLWLIKDSGGKRYYVYVGSLETDSGRFTDFFMLRSYKGIQVEHVLEAEQGVWRDKTIKVREGSAYNFRKGSFTNDLKNFSFRTEIALSEVSLFAEKIAHLSMASLVSLYLKGERVGFEADRYMGELLHRVAMSLLPAVVLVPLALYTLRYRNIKVGALAFFTFLLIGWSVAISPKLIVDRTGLSVNYSLFGFLLIFLIILKGVYDLRKGFRF